MDCDLCIYDNCKTTELLSNRLITDIAKLIDPCQSQIHDEFIFLFVFS
jgi:hypothetical protein